MRMLSFLLFIAGLSAHAGGKAQSVTLSGKDISFKQVFSTIKKQTGYVVGYDPGIIPAGKTFSLVVNNLPLREFLDMVLKDLSLKYDIQGKTIFIARTSPAKPPTLPVLLIGEPAAPPLITGRVSTESGEPLAGATVKVKGHTTSAQTNDKGEFDIRAEEGTILIISFVGFQTREVKAVAGKKLLVSLVKQVSGLDETVIIAYGTTTRRFNTSSVTKVTAAEIEKQPVSNPLGALSGRVPGMKVVQADGLPGGWFDIIIRGRNSLTQGYRPLILIDGIPFTNESTLSSFPGTNIETSPLNLINPGDIESIEILKDADATAIYGSRGSNGVVLITTKKGKKGRTGLDINAYTGITNATVKDKFMNTEQYLEMRREAFRNDNIVPNIKNAPDLVAWDQNRYIDWTREFNQKQARTSNIQLDLNGGSQLTQFRLGAGFHYETPLNAAAAKLVGKNLRYYKGSVQLNTTHRSANNKLNLSVSAGYNFDESNFSGGAMGNSKLPPNAPYPLDADGKLVWSENGGAYNNPLADLLNFWDGKNTGLNSSANLSLELWKNLNFKLTAGFNSTDFTKVSGSPKASRNPATNPQSFALINEMKIDIWQVEPMLQYKSNLGAGKLEVLVGQSWHAKHNKGLQITAWDYKSDDYMGTLSGAASIETRQEKTDYYYHGLYARINYNLFNKYIINLTGRRDGSSRFGPGRRYSNFGAAGLAWIFTEESWMKTNLPFLSFGKLRGNYGVTGNDNIGDYMYLDLWNNPSVLEIYDGQSGLSPSRLFNSDYSWEKNLKMEWAIELGFLKDRLLLNVNYYRSRAGNQLINYTLPGQVGFTSILKNFEAVIQNYGWEWTIDYKAIQKQLKWTISLNSSVAKSKLLSFPGIEKTSYGNTYAVGAPFPRALYYPFIGLNSTTGLFEVKKNSLNDRVEMRSFATPWFYGGLSNSFEYKGFSLDIFCQFVGQKQSDFTKVITAPGAMVNQPVQALDRWQKPGDITRFQRYTTGGAAATAFNNYKNSTAGSVDGSFIRLKNLSLSYSFNKKLLDRFKIKGLRLFFQGQNLGLITNYELSDPESGGYGNPLLKVYSGGFHLSL